MVQWPVVCAVQTTTSAGSGRDDPSSAPTATATPSTVFCSTPPRPTATTNRRGKRARPMLLHRRVACVHVRQGSRPSAQGTSVKQVLRTRNTLGGASSCLVVVVVGMACSTCQVVAQWLVGSARSSELVDLVICMARDCGLVSVVGIPAPPWQHRLVVTVSRPASSRSSQAPPDRQQQQQQRQSAMQVGAWWVAVNYWLAVYERRARCHRGERTLGTTQAHRREGVDVLACHDLPSSWGAVGGAVHVACSYELRSWLMFDVVVGKWLLWWST